MYADHHVTEVRRILLALPGIEAVSASSAFHVVEITHDPSVVTESAITQALDEAGYLQAPDIPTESGIAAYGREGNGAYFRHTAAYLQTRRTVGFSQATASVGRPLWPCPGIGVVRKPDDSE
jgi:copper chaperone CopZ